MSVPLILIVLAGLAILGFVLGRRRSVQLVDGDARRLHSRPNYHGTSVALAAVVPAFLVLLGWLLIQPIFIESRVAADFPEDAIPEGSTIGLVMGDVNRLAAGLQTLRQTGALTRQEIVNLNAGEDDIRGRLGSIGLALGSDVSPATLEAARQMRLTEDTGRLAMTVVVLALAAAGFGFVLSRISADGRARNTVESVIRVLLMLAATVAILTTVGIIASMLFETINFFGQYPITEFFFGTNWAPNFRGNSDLGIIPLLWGTMYISLIALLVAVPVGLFSAIYLSEYASPTLRGIAKPLIEVLAGIPTIVYGLFALLVVGPMLRDYFAQPLGLGSSGSSVMTAGLVMGIMLIPFVSSLSDDIISAVPQSMRDGSLGLGATKAETIRQVVVPAALPGIVGAVLLAASRAIGETMIVVLGAGAAARLSLNPFEAMTTVTVKIVSQLTGDTNFASPETLVAFALGLTLFVITLGLNVLALIIVRRYREQYE
ncbi:Phosphate transport system permease protein PstC [Rhodobacteraceae bacterium THAF1]|uniref:phosphate ABC transporter permease subunit PstC n=1 Tax=Palleronia sp. THAF1 TaxID=2587842 RepID=UPI000F407AC8|nr:phosphate ABC transporter permease subunit PstC [Palleronia sp. THAF1]QFU08437.1 Phosphate transport system permease protein PstC [Palleronia sp. THAF1]VDC29288.1 Phosphate transport system permease protein PstC [Rhodobacteraceae bacterium THAF1]